MLTDKPDEARLPPATRRVLRTLVQRPRARVFFISGRRRSDLVKRVRLSGCEYLGLFGFEGTARAATAHSAAVQRPAGAKPRRAWPACHVYGSKTKGWPSSCITGTQPPTSVRLPGGACAPILRSSPGGPAASRARTDSKWFPEASQARARSWPAAAAAGAAARGSHLRRRRPVGRGGVPRRASWCHDPSRPDSPHGGPIPAGGRERRPSNSSRCWHRPSDEPREAALQVFDGRLPHPDREPEGDDQSPSSPAASPTAPTRPSSTTRFTRSVSTTS